MDDSHPTTVNSYYNTFYSKRRSNIFIMTFINVLGSKKTKNALRCKLKGKHDLEVHNK